MHLGICVHTESAAEGGRAGSRHGHKVWLQVWESQRAVKYSKQSVSRRRRKRTPKGFKQLNKCNILLQL